jgi:tetratricopeptide (TPR) repeat protein
VVEQIVAKTDGVPLFVEELTKMVLESGLLQEQEERYALTAPLPPLAIPSTLHDSLMARLDRLATVKAMAQLGATLGREFSYDLLQAVAPWDEDTLQRGRHQLVEAEFLYQRGLPPQATYAFKHALIQDAAYQSLLKSTRQQYHQCIAQVLEARFPETSESEPELLAHHYPGAGLSAQAIPYWRRAGERAVQRSAYVEAIAHLTRGLEVLTALPQAPERTQRELDLWLTLGPAFMALKGVGAPEVEQTYTQAYELCQQLRMDTSPQLLQVLYGLRRVYIHRGNLPKAQEISKQYLRLAQQLHDVHMEIDAYFSLGLSLIERGEVIAAQAVCEHGIALDTRPLHGMAASGRTAIDPGVMGRIFVAWPFWVRGYPEQALCKGAEALALAQALANPLVRSQALVLVAWLHQYRREIPAMQEQVEAAMALASEHAYIQQWAWGMVLHGWADPDRMAGLTQMRQGLDTLLASGTVLFRPYLLALFAEGHGALGQLAEGLHILDEALGLVEKNGQRLHEAELYRLKGELLLKQSVSDTQQAEACLHQALTVARRQEAKSWELRAGMSLRRLWQHQGKRDEARQWLTPIYGWFTEGFGTTDLQEAKALLEELS